MRLIDNWKEAWRWASVRCMALTVAVLGTWQAIPDDLKVGIPQGWIHAIAAALLVLGMLGRILDLSGKKTP